MKPKIWSMVAMIFSILSAILLSQFTPAKEVLAESPPIGVSATPIFANPINNSSNDELSSITESMGERIERVSAISADKKNDFSQFIDKGSITPITQEEREKIDSLLKLVESTTIDDILNLIGGRKTILIPKDKDERSYDLLQLDDSFLTIKENKDEFVTRLVQAYPDTELEVFESEIKELLFSASYFYRWYNVKIGDKNLWNVLMFNHRDLVKENQTNFEALLDWNTHLKAQKKDVFNSQSNKIQDTFSSNNTFINLDQKTYKGLIEWFVEKEAHTTNYTSWFREYFNGIIYKDTKMSSKYDIGTWKKRVVDDLPFLVTLRPDSDFIICELFKETLYTTQNAYTVDIKEAMGSIAQTFDNFFTTIIKTKVSGQYNIDNLRELRVRDRFRNDFDVHILDDPSDLADYYISLQEFNVIHSVGAFGGNGTIQMAFFPANTPHVLAHELSHELNGIFKAGGEFFSSYHDSRHSNPNAAFINDYISGSRTLSETRLTNSNPNRFQSKQDLIEYASRYESLIYVMDAALAEVILELPLSEQVKYLRNVDIDVDDGYFIQNEKPTTSFVDLVHEMSVEELKSLNLHSIEDLIDAGISIIEPGDKSNVAISYGTSLTHADFYLHQGRGDAYEANQRIINTTLAHDGWEGFIKYNEESVNQPITSVSKALKKVYNDPDMTFRTLTKDNYQTNRDKAKKDGLKNQSYDEIKRSISRKLSNFYAVKADIVTKILETTDEFNQDIFGRDSSLDVKVSTYSELISAMSNEENQYKRIVLENDIVTKDEDLTTAVLVFKGKLDGQGHTISGLRFPLVETLENSTIESLILNDVSINNDDNDENEIGALAKKMVNASIYDVHVSGSIMAGKNTAVGAITGSAMESYISDSSAKVELAGQDTGGIVGRADHSTLINVYSLGKISTGRRVGGIIGNGFNRSSIINAYSKMTIDSHNASDPNGILGTSYSSNNSQIDVTNTVFMGNVLADKGYKFANQYLGGSNLNNYELDVAKGISSIGIKEFDITEVTEQELKQKEFYKNDLDWDTEKIWNTSHASNGHLFLRNSDPHNLELDAPKVNDITNDDEFLTGTGLPAATIRATVDGKIISTGTVNKDGEFKLVITKQPKNTAIYVRQEIKDLLPSPETCIIVVRKEIPVTHQFKLGYWKADKKFILEGRARLEGINFDNSGQVEKFIEILDEKGTIHSSTKATNTNWYDKDSFDGYQASLTSKVLETLLKGSYKLQVRLVFENEEYVVPVTESSNKLRGINDHSNTIAGINGYSIGTSFFEFSSMNDQMIINVQILESFDDLNYLSKYNGSNNTRIIDGWFSGNYDFNREHQKNLIIKDQNDQVVKTIENIPTWNILEQFNIDIFDDYIYSGFQATVPSEYRGNDYKKYVQVIDIADWGEIIFIELKL